MKNVATLFAILITVLTTQTQAVTVAGISGLTLLDSNDSVTATPNFLNSGSAGVADIISQATLHSNLTDNQLGTYVLSVDSIAYVDVEFVSSSIYNGAGTDLAFFFEGSIDSSRNVLINFDITINGITNNYTPALTPEPTVITDAFSSYTLTAALVDLDDFGMGFSNTEALGSFRVLFGTDNSQNLPALTMMGGFYTSQQPATVPLPLPLLLFTSGLAALGLFARKSKI